MKFNPDIHHRRSVRLQNYDYSQAGLYFVTICVQNRECLFGQIVDYEMVLNEMGQIACAEWLKTAELRTNVQLHNFVVMPNHFHGILEITEHADGNYVLQTDNGALPNVGAGRALPLRATPKCAMPHECANNEQHKPRTNELPQSRFQNIGKNTLSSIVGGFKSAVTHNIRLAGYGFAWQRNMWEHVIRDFDDYARITDYIDNNPAQWQNDRFFVE